MLPKLGVPVAGNEVASGNPAISSDETVENLMMYQIADCTPLAPIGKAGICASGFHGSLVWAQLPFILLI